MLQKYKEEFLHSKTQFVLIDLKGKILSSDNVLFPFKPNTTIEDAHPFFLNFQQLIVNAQQTQVAFSCVHLNIADQECIADLNFHLYPEKNEVLLIIHDLSEHYNAYQKVAQKKNESIIQEELLTIKNLRLKEKEDFRNQFIANFSHELRGPLTSIIAFSELLNKTPLNSEQQEYLRLINSFSDHLKVMMDDILNIKQIDLNSFEINEDFFNFRDLILVLEETYKLKTQAKGLSFKFEIDEKIPEVLNGDKLRLTQVLTNLLENALKFTLSGGISVVVKLNQKRANTVSLKFIVKDTGIGIPEEKLDSIFEGFSQVNKEHQQYGSGLGLAVVKKILSLFKSTIKAESKVGEGTKFSFNLTLKYPVSTSEKKKSISKKKQEVFVPPTFEFKHHILLVEDDPLLQMLIFKMLIGTKNFYVDIVYSGEEALEKVTEKGYDLILMDIKLPKIDGVQTAKLIKEIPSRKIKTIPILALTGVVFEENLKTYKKSGFKDIIKKPFKEEDFLRTVYKYIK